MEALILKCIPNYSSLSRHDIHNNRCSCCQLPFKIRRPSVSQHLLSYRHNTTATNTRRLIYEWLQLTHANSCCTKTQELARTRPPTASPWLAMRFLVRWGRKSFQKSILTRRTDTEEAVDFIKTLSVVHTGITETLINIFFTVNALKTW